MSADRDRLTGDRENISQLASRHTLQEEELRQRAEELDANIKSLHRGLKNTTGIRSSVPVGIGR